MFKAITVSIVLLMVSACQQNPVKSDDGYTQVTETELASLFDTRLTADDVYVIVRSDGTFDGKESNGDSFKGTWEVRDGYWCRVITQSEAYPTGVEDCQLWERNGDKVKGTRKKGKGQSFIYTVK